MNQPAQPSGRGRAGWTEAEETLLWEQVKRTRQAGEPLKKAFAAMAQQTGRKPNSIRNYYYAKIKEGHYLPEEERCAFTPFSREEIQMLLETVLHGQAQGMSVRSITMQMGGGDKKAMLRYQNKYRSLVKNNPEAVYAALDRLREKELAGYDPYSQPRVHKAGRKPGSKKMDTQDALMQLGASLKQVPGVDAAAFLQQLATLASIAGQKSV